jgi:hypothetical protein
MRVSPSEKYQTNVGVIYLQQAFLTMEKGYNHSSYNHLAIPVTLA